MKNNLVNKLSNIKYEKLKCEIIKVMIIISKLNNKKIDVWNWTRWGLQHKENSSVTVYMGHFMGDL